MPDPDRTILWRVAGGRSIPLTDQPAVMGVLNVTPDSFSDGGLFADVDAAIAQGLMLARGGADIIDVGGESTRPGSRPVPPDEQIRRTVPVIRALADRCPAVISIDTRSAEVADAALDAGAHAINDVSALRDDAEMAGLAARRGAGLVLMHMQGTPETMQSDPRYDDVVEEVRRFLDERARFAIEAGVGPEHVAIDPGLGFGKSLEHNLTLLGGLGRLVELGYPVAVGPSRKRFIGDLTGAPVNERLAGTLAACVLAVGAGASIVRVHNPGPVRQALAVARAIRAAGPPAGRCDTAQPGRARH